PEQAPPAFDPDLYDPAWLALVGALAARPGVTVAPGEDVPDLDHPQRAVVGRSEAVLTREGRAVHLVDSGDARAAAALAAPARAGACGIRIDPSSPDALPQALAALEAQT